MLGREAISAIDSETFSVIILDLGLPDMDGMQVLHLLRQQSTLPILILTARDAMEDRIGGLDAGADDYVLKPFNLQELLARLRVVMRRAEGRASQILTLGALSIDEARHTVSWRDKDVKLGRREYALLLELARALGQGAISPSFRKFALRLGRRSGVQYGGGSHSSSA